MGAHQFHLERLRALGATAPSLQAQNDGIKDLGLFAISEASGQLGGGMLMGGDSAYYVHTHSHYS